MDSSIFHLVDGEVYAVNINPIKLVETLKPSDGSKYAGLTVIPGRLENKWFHASDINEFYKKNSFHLWINVNDVCSIRDGLI